MNHCGKAPIIFSSFMAITIIAIALRKEISIWLTTITEQKMNSDIIFWLLVTITFLMILGVFTLLFKHNKLIKERLTAAQKVAEDIHSISFFTRIIAYIAIIICLFIALHYICVHHSRILPFEGTGADYLGIIVGIMAALVTMLVGWQIFSTINAKDELNKAVKAIKEQYDKDIAGMKADIDKLKSSDIKRDIEQAEQKGIEQANEVDKDFVKLNFPQEIMDAVENQMKIEGTMLYVWAFNVADEYKTFRQIFDEFKSVQRKHPKRVAYIGGNQASDSKAKEIIKIARDSKLKMLSSIRAMRQDTDNKNGDNS